MKLNVRTISIILAAALGAVRPGVAQQAYPYQFQAQAYQQHAGYPSGYHVAQVAGAQPLGPTESVMAQPITPQSAPGTTGAPPMANSAPAYTVTPAPAMQYSSAYGCDDPGCFAGDCGASCGSNGGLFSGCGLLGGGGCGSSGLLSGGRVWGGLEYLLFWHKNRTLPTFATTSPQGTPSAIAGVLGQPTTSVLFANEEISDEVATGFRTTVGFWLDSDRCFGFGLRYFDMDDQTVGYNAQSDGDPILARPFFNSDPGENAEDALLVAFPGIATGGINATSVTDIDGFDAFGRYKLFCGYGNRIDAIVGYQHTEIDDAIRIRHNITSVNGFTHGPVGTEIQSQDRYQTSNEFDGGEIGFLSEACDGRLTWSLLTKIAFGNMRQGYTIDGSTRTTVPGAGSAAFPYGLLNLPSNSGSYERDEFAIVPELNVSVAFAVTKSFHLTLGYNFIYWSDVVMANQAIDTTINPTQVTGGLVGPADPTFIFPESQSFWTQGLSLGGTVMF